MSPPRRYKGPCATIAVLPCKLGRDHRCSSGLRPETPVPRTPTFNRLASPMAARRSRSAKTMCRISPPGKPLVLRLRSRHTWNANNACTVVAMADTADCGPDGESQTPLRQPVAGGPIIHGRSHRGRGTRIKHATPRASKTTHKSSKSCRRAASQRGEPRHGSVRQEPDRLVVQPSRPIEGRSGTR